MTPAQPSPGSPPPARLGRAALFGLCGGLLLGGALLLSLDLRGLFVAPDCRGLSEPECNLILEADRNYNIDNMEGLAVHTGPGGETRITIVSDNNFIDWQRTLLLEFALPVN